MPPAGRQRGTGPVSRASGVLPAAPRDFSTVIVPPATALRRPMNGQRPSAVALTEFSSRAKDVCPMRVAEGGAAIESAAEPSNRCR